MRKKSLFGFLVLIIVLFINTSYAQNTGSISGRVTPENEEIKVMLIQNLSLIVETITDNGYYEFSSLDNGMYGLLFIRGRLGYIYNDEFNQNSWRINDIPQQDKIEIINITKDQDSFNFDMNLNREHADYMGFVIEFKPTISEEEINSFLSIYNLSVKEIIDFSEYGIGRLYRFDIPDEKTMFEEIQSINLDNKVKNAYPATVSYVENEDKGVIENKKMEENDREYESKFQSFFSRIIQFLKSLFEFN